MEMTQVFTIVSMITIIFFLRISKKKAGERKITQAKKDLQDLITENDNFGFKKRVILFDFLPHDYLVRKFFDSNQYLNDKNNGIWVNYQDKLIKFKTDFKGNGNYIQIPFQNLYDVKMDSIGVSKTGGFGFGDTITIFGANTREHIKSITIQIVSKDPNGGVRTNELILCDNFFSVKRGTPIANAYEKCAAAILNEISYIIDMH